jgi:hypothetical protein
MSAFIINPENMSIVGFVQNAAVAAEKAGSNLVVAQAKDLESLSLQQMTDLYNKYSNKDPIGKLKVSKADAAAKAYGAMFCNVDTTKLVQLDKAEEQVVEKKASEQAAQAKIDAADAAQTAGGAKKERKVRDSKLQRMKAAFLQKDEAGNYKIYTIPELIAICGKPNDPMSERIANVYISILRSPKDRFIMNIEKFGDGDNKTFRYNPNPEQASAPTPPVVSGDQPQA